mmetsp:Transcript_4025/g.5896  ORF Transcript_4025/g.5896 Transcript_4025/m.5896 type:complete len:90 (-) Transcript_4025:68-337(-)
MPREEDVRKMNHAHRASYQNESNLEIDGPAVKVAAQNIWETVTLCMGLAHTAINLQRAEMLYPVKNVAQNRSLCLRRMAPVIDISVSNV